MARTAQGLNIFQLAQRTGINRSTLARIEDGATTQPSVGTLNVLARHLDLDPEDLYDARWKDNGEPLPSPSTYFRSKFGVSDEQMAQLQSAVERITNETDNSN